jgi:hypothetical protein
MFPNYIFYNDGSIYNITKKRFLKKNLSINKYEYVFLCNNRFKRFFYVHRLMYLLFCDCIDDGFEIDHINHIRDDNDISNLRCVSIQENRQNRNFNNNNYKEIDKKHNDKYKDKKYYNKNK